MDQQSSSEKDQKQEDKLTLWLKNKEHDIPSLHPGYIRNIAQDILQTATVLLCISTPSDVS